MINSKVRSEVTKLVSSIESLAARVRAALISGTDVIVPANELVANTATLTFSLGELYALESPQIAGGASVSSAKTPQVHYHNVRDNRGRFTRVSTTLP